ncbi:hypothetical protein COCCADRAFT_112171 [Bipolaris zeicola 26-R-13]|uniref:aldehyde dehydrogenase (NAD(+)) n=1 Tax=Cochliobolus carbonum (strain 26-R-13) TaxID=930089 RepID=W6XP47_COCC2|nr:uncharacterized protein COCCADRAFT_112171 [Bipolaris zeicola 26-R-13]EUC27263.1 hypothetical protein COCCADRAFT_112171 [Bipolaris zeicola 26-R-13]
MSTPPHVNASSRPSISFDLNRYSIPSNHFIDGRWTTSKSNNTQSYASAVNDQVICEDFQWAGKDDVEDAVESAARGLKEWQSLSKAKRRDALLKYGKLVKDHAEQIFWLEAILVGKTRKFSMFEIDHAVEALTYYAGLTFSLDSRIVEREEDHVQYIIRQPYGICAIVLPFNGPLVCYCMKVAAALAAGNSVVVKASELNPFSTLLAVSLAIEAGIPSGVINCITGDGSVGKALAEHMKIRKISFTGSLAVGCEVQVAAARSNLKDVTLQLSGNSPIIVFPDADLDKAARHCGMFLALNGQGCTLGTRVYLHKSIFKEMLPKIESLVQSYDDNLGSDPLEDTTWSSPLFHHRQRERVLQYIEQGKKEATLLCGGEPMPGPGCFLRPAIFVDPLPDARILKEEIFGPVLVVLPFEDDDEILRLANDTEYGLRAYVWTKDLGRAFRFTNLLEAGCVGVNEGPWSLHTTYGGWKQSGVGLENGEAGLLDWVQSKSVMIRA